MDPTASPLSPSEQIRIRRERRQARVKSSAGARLNRITSTQGQTFRREDETPPPEPVPTADPPEIDISAHHYEPRARQQDRLATEDIFANMMNTPPAAGDLNQPSDMDLRQMLMSMNQGSSPGTPGMGMPGMGAGEDPMMAMLQQMMAGGGGMPDMGGPGMQMPPGMEGLAGMMGGMQSPQQIANDWGLWWRVLHSICALILGLWAVRATGWGFAGSSLQRVESANLATSEKPLFWYFTTMELILQSSRFFLEKGRPPPGSWLSTIGGFLPHPFGTVLTTIARYSVIWTTILADAGVLLFCLGVFAWWNT